MPCIVKINFKKAYTAVTVTNGHNPYVDKNNVTLENLSVLANATYEISVALINGVGAVIAYATDGANNLRFTYTIPDDCDGNGNINVPKTAAVSQAASQADFEKLAQEVEALKERFAASPR